MEVAEGFAKQYLLENAHLNTKMRSYLENNLIDKAMELFCDEIGPGWCDIMCQSLETEPPSFEQSNEVKNKIYVSDATLENITNAFEAYSENETLDEFVSKLASNYWGKNYRGKK